MCARATVGVQRVARAGPAVPHEVGLGVHDSNVVGLGLSRW